MLCSHVYHDTYQIILLLPVRLPATHRVGSLSYKQKYFSVLSDRALVVREDRSGFYPLESRCE